MNRFIASAIVATAVSAAGHVLADDITPSTHFVSTAERAQVQAELTQFRTMRNPWSIAYNPLSDFKGGRTRSEVRAEYIASRSEVAALTREDSGSSSVAQIRLEDASQVAQVSLAVGAAQ